MRIIQGNIQDSQSVKSHIKSAFEAWAFQRLVWQWDWFDGSWWAGLVLGKYCTPQTTLWEYLGYGIFIPTWR